MTESPPDSASMRRGAIVSSLRETAIRVRPPVDEGRILTRSRKTPLSSDEAAMVTCVVTEVVGMVDRGEPARDAATRKVLTEIAFRLEQEAPGQGLNLAIACGLPCARTIAASRKAKRMKPAAS